MEQKGKGTKRDRIIAGGGILLFAGSLSFAMILKNENADLLKQLYDLRTDQGLLIEQRTKTQMDLMDRDMRLLAINEERREELARSRREQERLQEELQKARQAHALAIKANASKKDLDQMKADLTRMEQMLAAANGRVGELTAENGRLRGSNEKLVQELAQAGEVAATVNNSLVLAMKGRKKERLTVKARRTHQLHVDFELPETLTRDLRMKITSPEGRTYNGGVPSVAASNNVHYGEATASTGMGMGSTRKMSRVSLKVHPKEKLVPGTYRIDVYSGNTYLGTTRTTLR